MTLTVLENRHSVSFMEDSGYVDIGTTTTTVTLPTGPYAHYYVAVQFYAYNGGTGVYSVAYPTAATATFTVMPAVLPGGQASGVGISLTGGAVTITATANGVVNWSGYANSVTCALTGITAGSATHYVVRVNGFVS